MLRQSLPFTWKQKLNVFELKHFETVFYLNSNHSNKINLLALGEINRLKEPNFKELERFQNTKQDWLFGYFAYDLKNQLEELNSENPCGHSLNDMEFVVPELVLEWRGNQGLVHYFPEISNEIKIQNILNQLMSQQPEYNLESKLSFLPRISKQEYLQKVNELKTEIQYGNIYEINYCQEFFANREIDPYSTYQALNEISPTPYSCFVNLSKFYLMCASPEQYLEKSGDKIISKPIKGTIKRSRNLEEDQRLKEKLYYSEKDRSENVMIVDLVRNDLSKCAEKGSVNVDELYGIYSFAQVHQMISTVSATLKKNVSGFEAIKNSFPMGSMTGAPKIKAMQLIEKEESFKRDLYSGSVGYFTPKGDFNFNVIIRSLFYSSEIPLITFAVGGAITDGSDALEEYEESMLKAKAIFNVFD